MKDARGTLLEVGTKLFAERGLYGVGIRELSQAAGTSISMVSYYYGSKEGLYAAVLTEQFACFAEIDAIGHQEGSPEAKIEAYLRWTIQRHRNHPYLLRFYTGELTNPSPCFATIVAPAVEKVIRSLTGIITEGVTLGVFRADINAVDAALALAGMINYFFLSTLATEALTTHSPAQDEVLVQQYLAIFTRGITSDARLRESATSAGQDDSFPAAS